MLYKIQTRISSFIQKNPNLYNYACSIAFGGLFAILLYSFFVRPFIVVGQSMYPNFNTSKAYFGDYLIIDVLTTKFKPFKRGQVIVAKNNCNTSVEYVIKRIIGIPKDTIEIKQDKIYINNVESLEVYINTEKPIQYKNLKITLGTEEFFIMGDNRSNSLDSRICGAIEKKNIIGEVVFRILPLNGRHFFPGQV